MKTPTKNLAGIIRGMIFFLAMVPTVIVHRIVVVAKLPRNVDHLIIRVYAIIKAMSDNAWFPDASSMLADLKTKNERLEAAQTIVNKKVLGSVPDRNVKKNAVIDAVYEIMAYIQQICYTHPESAVAIAESALFHAKKINGNNKFRFTAKSISSGVVQLRGSVAGYRRVHNWEMTRTPDDPSSWYFEIIPSTLKGTVLVKNLTPGETVYFRHRLLTVNGASEWDQVISIIVN